MATPKKTMEKLNMKEVFPKLTHAEQVYVKKVERENYQRAQSVKTMRRKNFRWATGLCLFVAGTCILFSVTFGGHLPQYFHRKLRFMLFSVYQKCTCLVM